MIKLLLDVRWNIVDIFLLPTSYRFAMEGHYWVAAILAIIWFFSSVAFDDWAKKRFGWR